MTDLISDQSSPPGLAAPGCGEAILDRPSGLVTPSSVRSVAIASDHRGVRVKQQIVEFLKSRSLDVTDFGTVGDEACDYPDYARPVAIAVAERRVDRGILICGTGMGMNIAANKFRGIRAVQIHDDVTAEISRRHNDANVMCLSAELIGDRLLSRMIEVWLDTPFEGGRHQRRLDKVHETECGDIAEQSLAAEPTA